MYSDKINTKITLSMSKCYKMKDLAEAGIDQNLWSVNEVSIHFGTYFFVGGKKDVTVYLFIISQSIDYKERL